MRWLFKYRRLLTLGALGLLTVWQTLQSPQRWDKAGVYLQLIRLDWQVEKRRLLRLWAYSLLAVCFLLAMLIISSAVALALAWHTPYFALTCTLLIGGYGLAALACVLRVVQLAEQGNAAFAASRHEIAQALISLKGTP